ncbi:hypothetical protein [Saccharothrix xinjiangensis]|uniref:Uncharacterized protein n=1 Tax=Saccharothrix xinjiangensis TaxID=204798 RepID=A0ABV9Y2T1_9PSEU
MTWLDAVPALPGGHGAAHRDALLLAALDSCAAADLVFTRVDRTGPVAVTAVSAHVTAPFDPVAVSAALGGPVTVTDSPALDRCVRFPGQSALTGTHPAAEVVASSAIDRVVGVGVPVSPADRVETLGFLRPVHRDGELVLLVEPAVGGVLRPIESEDPHECCGGAH